MHIQYIQYIYILIFIHNNNNKADLILKQCENLTFSKDFPELPQLKAFTLNNWGCLYRRNNQEEKALESFKQAL